MANYVNSNLTFDTITEEGLNFIRKLYAERVRKGEGDRQWFPDMFVDGETLNYEETEQYAWTIENIGPKWSYIEDFDASDASFNIVSAWSAPIEGVEKLMEMLEEVDPNAIATMTYEDEMPNFVGAATFTCDGVNDSCDWDYDEIVNQAMEENPDLRAEWDSEEEEFSDEGHEILYEVMWDIISEFQSDWISEDLQYLKNGE